MDTPILTRKEMRREQESQLRRQEIMNAARILFVEKGFRNTTLDEIAEKSAFGKGTIYNYFANKDDLFHAIFQRLIDETLDAVRTAMNDAAEGARAKLSAYVLASASHFHANNEVFLMILREANQLDARIIAQVIGRFQEKLSLITECLSADMRAGRIRPADPQKLAALFDGMVRTYCLTVSHGLWPANGQTPAAVAELLVSVFFDGIESMPNQG